MCFLERLPNLKGRALFLLILFLLLPANSFSAEKAVMKVFLNTEDQGDHFVVMAQGAVLFPVNDLIEMGFKDIPKGAALEVDGEEYVTLGSFSKGMSFEIDEKEAIIRIMAEPGLFKKNVVDLASESMPPNATFLRGSSGFINYSLSYSINNDYKFTSLSIPLEAVVNAGGALFYSNFLYSKTTTDENFVRLLSNVTKDDPGTLRRYIAGDFFASSGGLGGGATLGGLSVSRNFALKPYFIKFPQMSLGGTIKTPSQVDIYVNGSLVRSERLSPGEFELLNIPNLSGSGEITMVIKDAYGKEERTTVPFYLSSALLKPGLNEYSYNVGFMRERLGEDNFGYGDLAFTATHRVGISENFTAGARAEGKKDTLNLGPTVEFLLGGGGEIDAAAEFSRASGKTGYGGALSYSYAGKYFNARFSVRGFSKEYANIGISPGDNDTKLDAVYSIGYNRESLGSISASFAKIDKYTASTLKRASIFYTRRLFKDISFFVTARRTKTDTVSNDIFAGLNFLLDDRTSGGVNYQSQDKAASETAYMQRNPPKGVGFGYRAAVERKQEPQQVNGNGSVLYNGPWGIYSVDYNRASGQNNYTLNASGAVAFINRSFYLSRPITDSFALVKVADQGNVKVLYSNQVIGETNKNGEVIVPDLISYYDNKISIDDTDIPINYEITDLSRDVSTPYRGGGVVNFAASKVQGFTGTFFFLDKGVKKAAEYAGIEIKADGKTMVATVGKNGEFYLENLPKGTFPARLYLKNKDCRFDMHVPESDEMLVDMGEVSCEIH